MKTIIDLSQELFERMPVYKDMPEVHITIHRSHEQWEGIENPITRTPSVLKLQLGDHTGSHVDAISHMGKEYKAQSIDQMPLHMFYTEGICLDLAHKKLQELISETELKAALDSSGQRLGKGDTLLIYTDHYRKYFGTANWDKGPGITEGAARWLGGLKIASFGVETMSPGVPGISNREVHQVCGEYGFTHYENLINLHQLVGKGRFRFIGFPLKIRGGTGSPVRAVAVFD